MRGGKFKICLGQVITTNILTKQMKGKLFKIEPMYLKLIQARAIVPIDYSNSNI